MKINKVITGLALATSLALVPTGYSSMSEKTNSITLSYTLEDLKKSLGDRWTWMPLSRRQEMEKDWKDAVKKEEKQMKIRVIDIYRSPRIIYNKLEKYEREYINNYKIQSEDIKMVPWIIPGTNTLEDKIFIYIIRKMFPLIPPN